VTRYVDSVQEVECLASGGGNTSTEISIYTIFLKPCRERAKEKVMTKTFRIGQFSFQLLVEVHYREILRIP